MDETAKVIRFYKRPLTGGCSRLLNSGTALRKPFIDTYILLSVPVTIIRVLLPDVPNVSMSRLTNICHESLEDRCCTSRRLMRSLKTMRLSANSKRCESRGQCGPDGWNGRGGSHGLGHPDRAEARWARPDLGRPAQSERLRGKS